MIVDDDELRHPALNFFDVPEILRAENRNAILRMRPEIVVIGELFERLE